VVYTLGDCFIAVLGPLSLTLGSDHFPEMMCIYYLEFTPLFPYELVTHLHGVLPEVVVDFLVSLDRGPLRKDPMVRY
jgi:hypothetical protein